MWQWGDLAVEESQRGGEPMGDEALMRTIAGCLQDGVYMKVAGMDVCRLDTLGVFRMALIWRW